MVSAPFSCLLQECRVTCFDIRPVVCKCTLDAVTIMHCTPQISTSVTTTMVAVTRCAQTWMGPLNVTVGVATHWAVMGELVLVCLISREHCDVRALSLHVPTHGT